MNQNFVNIIGIEDESRKDAHLAYLNQVDGLKIILNKSFNNWSNFDSWESISAQQWIFYRALDVFRDKKIDIKWIVVSIIVFFQMILRILKKKNVLVKKVLI